jgi:hypothetical protein
MRWVLLTASLASILFVRTSDAHPGSGIAVADNGDVYFTDTGKGVWRIDEQGKLTLLSPIAMHWMAIDKGGAFADAPDEFGEWFGRITRKGDKPTLVWCSDFPCTVGADGSLYFAYMHSFNIKRRTPGGRVSDFVTCKNFNVDADRSIGVLGMASDSEGNIYAVSMDDNSGEHSVWIINKNSTVRLLVKNFIKERIAPEDRHHESRPEYCRGIAVDKQGNVFIAATGSRCVVKVTANGEAKVVLRSEKPWSPTGVDVADGQVFVLEYDDESSAKGRSWPPRVRKVNRNGEVILLVAIDRSKEEHRADK